MAGISSGEQNLEWKIISMNEEMFETLGLDAEAWTLHARGLYMSGMCLVMPVEKEMRILLEEGQGSSDHYVEAGNNFVGYCLSSGLLFGLAIENAYKTRKIIEGKITIKEGKLVGLRHDHDISKMVQEFNIELGPEEQMAVDSITCVVRDLGKYPVAKSAKER